MPLNGAYFLRRILLVIAAARRLAQRFVKRWSLVRGDCGDFHFAF